MKWGWILSIGLALLTTPVEVQAAPTNASDFDNGPSGDFQTAARRLRAGQLVRVTTDSTRFEMSWMGATHAGIAYRYFEDESGTAFTTGPDSEVARWSEVRHVDVRGRATNTGCAIGAALGVLGGVAAAVGLSQMTLVGGEPSSEGLARVAIEFGAVGAIAGVVGGGIIGSAFPKWHTIYRQKGEGKP
jgi:hypothetical protein